MALVACLLACSCGIPGFWSQPGITFTRIPPAGAGGASELQTISGRVTGASPKHRIVLFAKSGVWWVQPFSSKPFTELQPDSTFSTKTHLGTEYAALLVNADYIPSKTIDQLPKAEGPVLAVHRVKGLGSGPEQAQQPKHISFSGYDWEINQFSGESGGVKLTNLASNVWTDAKGFLHLRIARIKDVWTGAEVTMTRSLGYGTYTFELQKSPPMEPGMVLGLFTWDEQEAGQNHREIDVELSQWGDPATKNAQFVIQPYYVAANVFRFQAPQAALTHSFHWEPDKTTFETLSREASKPVNIVARQTFTAGVPSPGSQKVHLKLYPYGKSRVPLQNGYEVVIEKFTYLP